MTALAIGPACGDADGLYDEEQLELDDDDGEHGERPDASSKGLTTYDRSAAVPGFDLAISLGGADGEDVVLAWSSLSGQVRVHRATDPNLLRTLSLAAPLPTGVTSVVLANGATSYVDLDAASRTTETPMYFYRVSQGLQLSTMVMKATTATGPGYNRFALCMLGGPDSASDLQTMFGPSVLGVHQRIPGGTEYMNFRSWTPSGGEDFPLAHGDGVVVHLDPAAVAFHSLVGVVPTDETAVVSAERGYNWMTLPIFFDGSTDTADWVAAAQYWGVGAWNNLTQSDSWDWDAPGYDPFDMEVCRSYDVYLQDDSCGSNAACPAGEFCDYIVAATCGSVGSGRCFPHPLDCEGVPESPVEGCDGEQYDSPCEANLVGVSVRGPVEEEQCEGVPPPVITATYDNLGTFVTPMLYDAATGVTVTGSAPLYTIQGGGLGVQGGELDYAVDGNEWVDFAFDTPSYYTQYFVDSGYNFDGDWISGESFVEAFDEAGVSLGSASFEEIGRFEIRQLFPASAAISRFRITANVDGVRIRSVTPRNECQEPDPCEFSPCYNGGTCSAAPGGGYECTCPDSFTGSQCETWIDPCNDEPCLNDGYCYSDWASSMYTCYCPEGSSGTNCECTQSTVSYNQLGTSSVASLYDATAGVTVTGSAPLYTIQGGGLGVQGGELNYAVDGNEWVDFAFDTPSYYTQYFVDSGYNFDGDLISGESFVEAFDEVGVSLGSVSFSEPGAFELSELFPASTTISRLRITANVDGVRLRSVTTHSGPAVCQ